MRPRPPPFTLFPYTTLFRSSWIYYAKQPLHIDELPEAIAVKETTRALGPKNLNDIPTIVECCQGLVIMDEWGSIRLFHRSEEHTSELQSPMYLVCRLLLEKK